MLWADISPESEFALSFGNVFIVEPLGSIGYTKIHRSAVGTAYTTLGFFPHVEGSALPVVLAIAAVGEKEWVRLGMKELSAPDTRVEVVHRLLLTLTLTGLGSG